MFTATMKTGLAIMLLAAASVEAASREEGMPTVNPPAISTESKDRFLGNVRDYGTGQPSPNILYSTGGIADATNSPEALKGPSITSTGTPPEKTPLSGGLLHGQTLERRTNQPYQVQPGTLERRTVTPTPIQSTWH